MTRLSIETSFAWAQRFVAREWGLLLPIALAFIAFPPLVLSFLTPPDLQQVLLKVSVNDVSRVQAVLVWLFPLVLVILAIGAIGGLAITALALTPRMSVGEAIVRAARRLPVFVASAALLSLALTVFAVCEMILFTVIGLDPARAQAIVITVLIVCGVTLTVRMSPLPAVIADRRIGPIDAISEAWRLGRGAGWKMLLALLVYYIGALVVVLALGTAIGACILAITRLGGWVDLAAPLLAVVDRVLGAIAAAGAYIVGVSFYRQLSGRDKPL